MKPISLFALLLALAFAACHKTGNDDDFIEPETSYPGALDSFAVILRPNDVVSDSGVYTGTNKYGMIKLAYDSEKRVTKMIADQLAFTFSDHYFSFYYNGTDKNAYLMKDSLPPYMANDYSVIHEHKLYYDNQGRKILDTTRTYHHSHTNGGRRLEETEVTNFHYTADYMTSSKVPASTYIDNLDTLFLNANGDGIRRKYIKAGGWNDSLDYHTVESPYGKLNVANSLFRVALLHSNVFTPNQFDFEQPKHLVKTLKGFDDFSDLYTLFRCYYQTDAANRVDGITFARYEHYKNQAPVFQWYAAIRFYYHQ